MKKIAVTGATSMIGIALIEECVKKNIEVSAIVRKKTKNINRENGGVSSMLKIRERSRFKRT